MMLSYFFLNLRIRTADEAIADLGHHQLTSINISMDASYASPLQTYGSSYLR